jgi:hypothetical protein
MRSVDSPLAPLCSKPSLPLGRCGPRFESSTSLQHADAKQKPCEHGLVFVSAAGLGLEPRYTAPEAVVLPLDDPAILASYIMIAGF